MSAGIVGFNNSRLSQIREARGLTAVSLAELVGVSASTISQYEHGHQKPRQSTLDRLSQVLNVPVEFFLQETPQAEPSKLFYRSMSVATKQARSKAEQRYNLLVELSEYLLDFLDFPKLDLPELDLPADFRELNPLTIESAAEQVRQFWYLGNSPIDDVVRTLESHGIVVWRTYLEAETLDAFSEYREPHPFIVLAADKVNYYRSRFDAAHELGHLVLHRHVDRKNLRKASDFKLIENQAHHFASSFLLPAQPFSEELWDVSLDAFRALKPRWKTSIATMAMRSTQLGLIDENQAKRLWINLSRRGWRKREPLDDSVEPESPQLIRRSVELLVKEGIKTREQILSDLRLHVSDVEKLVGYEPGEFIGGNDSIAPRVRNETSKGESNVVEFRRKR